MIKSINAGLFAVVLGTGSLAQADLVSVWGFDETGGSTAVDSRPAGNDGTLVGGAARVASGATEGPFGQVLSVTGGAEGTHLVSAPDDSSLDFADSFSVQAWINPSAAGGNIATQGSVSDRGWLLSYSNIAGGNRVRFAVYSGNSFADRYEATSFLVDTNAWTHITAVFDAAGNDGAGVDPDLQERLAHSGSGSRCLRGCCAMIARRSAFTLF